MLTAEQLSEHPFLTRLGPDVLDPALPWQAVAARLQSPRFHGRQLGSLYLDQGFVAGTGNYLRSEILFLSGLHPSRKPRDLSHIQRNRLARQTGDTARRSYETRGVTNPPKWVRPLQARGSPRVAYRFAVFGRAGRPCHACGSTIERVDVASRRLYLCPTCQG
jgi:endonuclease-8